MCICTTLGGLSLMNRKVKPCWPSSASQTLSSQLDAGSSGLPLSPARRLQVFAEGATVNLPEKVSDKERYSLLAVQLKEPSLSASVKRGCTPWPSTVAIRQYSLWPSLNLIAY